MSNPLSAVNGLSNIFLILYAFAILLDVQFSDLDMKDFISLWFA